MRNNESKGKTLDTPKEEVTDETDSLEHEKSTLSMKDTTKAEKNQPYDPLPNFNDFLKMTENPTKKLRHGQGYDDDLGLTYIGSYPEAPYGHYGISRKKAIRAVHESKENPGKLAKDIQILRGYTDPLTDKTLRHIRELLQELHNDSKIEYKSLSTIVEDLITRSRLYLDFPNDMVRLVFVLWIIGTFLRSMFMWYPYLSFEGLRDVGKSTALEFLSLTCFNGGGNVSGGYTEADLHKSADSTMGFFAIDHLEEKLKSKDKRQVLNEFLENAWKLNASVNKRDQNTGEQLKLLLACSVALGTRRTTETIAEKGLTIRMQETSDNDLRQRSVTMHKDEYFQNIEKKLMAMALNYQDRIKKAYGSIPTIPGLGREYNKFLPLLAIAKVIDGETENKNSYFHQLKDYALEYRKNRKSEHEDTEEILLRLILRDKISTTTYQKLSDLMKQEGYDNYSWQAAKSDIGKLGVVKHYNRDKSPITLDIDMKRAQKRADTRGIVIEDNKQEDTPDDRKVKQANDVIPDYKNYTVAEKAIISELAGDNKHTVQSLIKELVNSGKYQENDVKEALEDMSNRGEIKYQGEWSK